MRDPEEVLLAHDGGSNFHQDPTEKYLLVHNCPSRGPIPQHPDKRPAGKHNHDAAEAALGEGFDRDDLGGYEEI